MINEEIECGEFIYHHLISEKKLRPGDVPSDVFSLLMEISGIRSKKMINALYANLVKGESRRIVCEKYDVNNGYLSTCLAKLEHINQIVCLLIKINHCISVKQQREIRIFVTDYPTPSAC